MNTLDQLAHYLGCSAQVVAEGLMIPRVHDLAHTVVLGCSLDALVASANGCSVASQAEWQVNEWLMHPSSVWREALLSGCYGLLTR